MTDIKNIQLQRYSDGTPSILRKPTVYTELHFYRKSDVLVQLTKAFCARFLPKFGDRTVDQMIQAARSIKQNISEGLTDGQTSFEVEMKLLGIAKGSNQELLEDYQDYLKAYHLSNWGDTIQTRQSRISRESSNTRDTSGAAHPRYNRLLAYCRVHNALEDYEPYFQEWTDEEMANTAICLCHMVDKAMSTFIATRDKEFVTEGGIRERMTAARLDARGTQKQIIKQQEDEITSLRAQVASLQRELQALKTKRLESLK